jgi:hypothetical protein
MAKCKVHFAILENRPRQAARRAATDAAHFSCYEKCGLGKLELPQESLAGMPGPQKNDRDLITAAGDMVVYCAGFPASYGRQPLYFQDATSVARAKIPPPKLSDSLQNVLVPEVQIS